MASSNRLALGYKYLQTMVNTILRLESVTFVKCVAYLLCPQIDHETKWRPAAHSLIWLKLKAATKDPTASADGRTEQKCESWTMFQRRIVLRMRKSCQCFVLKKSKCACMHCTMASAFSQSSCLITSSKELQTMVSSDIEFWRKIKQCNAFE